MMGIQMRRLPEIPPVVSALTAVPVSIVADGKKARK